MDFAAMFDPEQEQSTMQTMDVAFQQPAPSAQTNPVATSSGATTTTAAGTATTTHAHHHHTQPTTATHAPAAGVHTEEHGTPNPLGTATI